jgi:hypothetical protein
VSKSGSLEDEERENKASPGWYDLSRVRLFPGVDFMNQGPNEVQMARQNKSREWKTIRGYPTAKRADGMCLRAGRDFARGAEVYTIYGETITAAFLATYGFLHDNGASDFYVFHVAGKDIMVDPA